MHEVGMMQNVLATAVERAKHEGASHIRLLQMRVGEASGVVPESLQLAFDVVKKETIAEDARFQVESVPVVCYCPNCTTEFHPTDLLYECPECHQPYCEVRQGKEFELAFLEVS
ncbi:hydrogenase maturation nickel metallochaperone HypA [Chroococcidiopsis thermalis]|jgi:hydrogenase nickel incorporation protein HypA/HybF|uniref:Hydrogenase maturation factor HypA n=1 Tax=Chroococcidiopsis thermalis (strain PCC 7203) TaxID=251229 RepID=K9TYW6_CHRTP|nr:hydrogenase maturation nickel metallochaperone HypA [Chroococcidiopsis thermalis]AFY87351.1 Hydrogenase-3 nickel incorporation protein HypA [Chroococcidiopsis thermalis PCC 7203]PSB47805.1 hydrogenase maturation nickel metallochaperone HypA [Cyanosarcina cf. burmensis CCALA 770]